MKTKRLQIWYNYIYRAMMAKRHIVLKVKETEVNLVTIDKHNYISLPDMIKPFRDNSITQNHVQYRNTKKRLPIFLPYFVLSTSKILNIWSTED